MEYRDDFVNAGTIAIPLRVFDQAVLFQRLCICVPLVSSKIFLELPSALKNSYNCTSSTAQGGGGSFKDRTPIGSIGEVCLL